MENMYVFISLFINFFYPCGVDSGFIYYVSTIMEESRTCRLGAKYHFLSYFVVHCQFFLRRISVSNCFPAKDCHFGICIIIWGGLIEAKLVSRDRSDGNNNVFTVFS